MRRILFFVVILLSHIHAAAQLKTIDQQLLWLGLGIDADITSKFSAGLFSEERRFIFPAQRQQRVWVDIHANYQHSSQFSSKVGLWLFDISDPQNPFDAYLGEVKETRPYFTFTFSHTLSNGHKLQYALQSEYRIFRPVGSESFFSGNLLREDLRERLKLTYTIPLSSSTSLNLANELHLTVYSSGVQPFFNQNRLQAIFKHNLGRGFALSGGYIFWLQPTGNIQEYFARHITSLRFNYRFEI